MVRTQIYLPDDLYADLKLMAEANQTNISILIREGAAHVVKSRKASKPKNWRKLVGIINGGPKDVASNIDYYLYGKGNPKWQKS